MGDYRGGVQYRGVWNYLFAVVGSGRRQQSRRSLLTSPRFSVQPLTILGVTGQFSVPAENMYELCRDSFHVSIDRHRDFGGQELISTQVEFLSVMAWSLIHAGWMHFLLAIFNAHVWTMKYVTTFSADIQL